MESRNVRLELCTDCFSPFGGLLTSYSSCPVFVTLYDLSPSMCMKRDNLFLSLLIPTSKNLKKYLDIYLRPLIDELKLLWIDGIHTYDAFIKKNFTMKVVLMWMISDFPAYKMLSSWSTHQKLACPHCMHDTKSFVLKYGGKSCWFDCHYWFLPSDHPFQRQKDVFLKNTIKIDEVDLEQLSDRDMTAHVQNILDVT